MWDVERKVGCLETVLGVECDEVVGAVREIFFFFFTDSGLGSLVRFRLRLFLSGFKERTRVRSASVKPCFC